ncbi:MAG: CCA tRNA nucleotidyltransferase [Rhizomicrobium sp.]|nr:CCA tRNA nucleotidyltransferase [Rhizomicrobium sp.]
MTRLELQPWMTAPETVTLMTVLGEARFVGGVVRNALLGQPVSDIDIATPHRPEKVTALLQAAGIKAVPTGIAHGTITAVVKGKVFEVTTLRRDVATDGRHAVVAFTTDWEEDAERRDFTMNALYADADGTVYDSVGGIADLEAGIVRFVGDAVARIREDYLRILRFFRFHAWYGKGPLNAEALYACDKEKAGLTKLSGERIAKEMLKLLQAENPVPVLIAMGETGILPEIVPGASDIMRLRRLASLDAAMGYAPDGILRLAALLPRERAVLVAQVIAARWKLSNAQKDRLIAASAAAKDMALFSDIQAARRLLYRLGPERFRDALQLSLAEETRDGAQWRSLLTAAERLTVPHFPFSGADVLARGLSPGPAVGKVLQAVESWWIEHDFPEDAPLLAAQLDDAIKANP